MHVVIIGASGFLGRHVVRRLLSVGMQVTSVDLYEPATKEEKEFFVVADVFRDKDLAKRIEEHARIDAVVWLAATIRHISSVDERAIEDMNIMIEAPLRFLRTLKHLPSEVVYVSSIQVYGRPLYLPIDEGHPTHPLRTYGAAKLCAEHMLEIASRKYGIAASFLRVAFVYGPGQHRENVLPEFIDAVRNGKPPVVHGSGLGKRDDIYVGDVARAIELSIAKKASGVFNIASGHCHTTLDVARTVCRQASSELEPVFDRETTVWMDRCFVVDKARDVFGFEAATTFEEGVKLTWEASCNAL